MIDPKLNVTPKEPSSSSSGTPKSKEDAARLQKVSSSLSVNDTVAGSANLSTGAGGVDTSGVSSGAGAGKGMTKLNSDRSSVTETVPGARGSGTTDLSGSTVQATEANFPGEANESTSELEEMAHQAWCDRGCPVGSPEVDWQTAVERQRSKRGKAVGA